MTIPAVGGSTDTPAALGGRDVLDRNDFLQLLVAQLKKQDPLSPLDASQFASQLAQFSSVEQLIKIGDKLDAQAAAAVQSQLASQTSLGANLLGRQVLLNGSNVIVQDGEDAQVTIELPTKASRVTVEIVDEKGKALFDQEFNDVGAGRRTLTFDAGDLKPGIYKYQVIALDDKNATMKVNMFTTGHVDGVSFDNNAVQLRLNGKLVPLTEIIEILPTAAPTGQSTSSQE